MNKNERTFLKLLVIVLITLVFAFCYEIYSYVDYENRKESGNERWKQVEERIKKIEKKVEAIENGRTG